MQTLTHRRQRTIEQSAALTILNNLGFKTFTLWRWKLELTTCLYYVCFINVTKTFVDDIEDRTITLKNLSCSANNELPHYTYYKDSILQIHLETNFTYSLLLTCLLSVNWKPVVFLYSLAPTGANQTTSNQSEQRNATYMVVWSQSQITAKK